MLTVATIGVYGWDQQSFLAALAKHAVRRVVDVRQRRGVRGRQYAWANSLRLQHALAVAGIGYSHHPELAPTTELRHLQYAEDARVGAGKRSRVTLASEYTRRYRREILERVDLGAFVSNLPAGQVSALLCVERDAPACHRSLIAERLAARHEVRVLNI
ncbi:MAG: DUF488 family protein [Candidatus Dormibacteria bacterium]